MRNSQWCPDSSSESFQTFWVKHLELTSLAVELHKDPYMLLHLCNYAVVFLRHSSFVYMSLTGWYMWMHSADQPAHASFTQCSLQGAIELSCCWPNFRPIKRIDPQKCCTHAVIMGHYRLRPLFMYGQNFCNCFISYARRIVAVKCLVILDHQLILFLSLIGRLSILKNVWQKKALNSKFPWSTAVQIH